MEAGGDSLRNGAEGGLLNIGAREEGSRCEDVDLASALEGAGDMCLPEEEPCSYVTDECGDV